MTLRSNWICTILLFMVGYSYATLAADNSWPMLAHDPARSGATTTEIRPPFERKWYRLLSD
jgi:hypothetical protein